jgi:hypothetical protein
LSSILGFGSSKEEWETRVVVEVVVEVLVEVVVTILLPAVGRKMLSMVRPEFRRLDGTEREILGPGLLSLLG